MTTVGLEIFLKGDASNAEEAMEKFYTSVQALAKNVQSVFSNMGGNISNISQMFKPIADGAKNATQTVINESKARQQVDKEETQAALNASRLKIQAQREATAASRAATVAKSKELDLYGRLVADNQQLTRAYYNAAAAAHINSDATEETALKLKQMAAAALEGQERLKAIEAGAGRFQRNVGNYSGATQYLQQSIAQLSGEIPNFFQSMRIGFMSIGNNIQPISQAIKGLRAENAQLIAQGKQTVPVLGSVIKSLLGWQTILLVGVGIISRYGGELVDWATGADKAKAAAEALKKQQEELNQIQENANKTAGDQIGKLTALNATITNLQLPMSKRKSAYDELQKLYPSYLSNISQEELANGKLADIMQTKLVPAIIAAAKARAYEDKIKKITTENIDLEEKRAKAFIKSSDAYTNLVTQQRKNAKVSGRAAGQVTGGFAGGDFIGGAKREKEFAQAQADVDSFTKKINENKASIDRWADGLVAATSETGELTTTGTDPLATVSTGADKAAKKIKKVAVAAKELTIDLNGLKGSMLFGGSAKEEFHSYIQGIEDAKKRAAELAGSFYNNLGIQDPRDAVKRRDVYSQFEDMGLDASQYIDARSTPKEQAKEGENALKGLRKEYNKLESTANKALGRPIDSFVGAIFEGQNAMEALGNSIKSIVSELVAAIAKAAIFNAIISAINPAANAAGGGFLGILGKLIPFASGGVVTGPTPALVGEAGPEAIIPLNKLGSIMGGQNMTITINSRLRGRDLDQALDNQNTYIAR